jgi:hypothetical protein
MVGHALGGLQWRCRLPLYEPEGSGWLRGFGGGLLVTCGLGSVGRPSEHAGLHWGLHGHVANIPASRVQSSAGWEDDEYVMTVSGVVRKATVLGEALERSREIRTSLGQASLRIDDVVTNIGPRPASHMYRYHGEPRLPNRLCGQPGVRACSSGGRSRRT